MNIKKIITVGVAGVAMGAMALDKVEVTGVTARQRYPWNGLVDIDFTTDSTPTEPYQMKVVAFDNVGKTNLPVKTCYTDGVSFKENPCMVRTDTRRILWDAAADLPNGFKATNVLVSCQDVRANPATNTYMIVDLSGGTNAEHFAVSYTNAPPAGGWTEEYMTEKLVLRRIEPNTFKMGSDQYDEAGHQANETLHTVTLTKPYYIGVYELTEKQSALILGGEDSFVNVNPIKLNMDQCRGCLDMGCGIKVGTASITGLNSTDWLINIAQTGGCLRTLAYVGEKSLMGTLRLKTDLQFDLPTEAQWESACRSGSAMPLYLGVVDSTSASSSMKSSEHLDPTRTYYLYIGNSVPNAAGVFDIAGSVDEWCLDGYQEDLGTADLVDPVVKTKIETGTYGFSFWTSDYYGYNTEFAGVPIILPQISRVIGDGRAVNLSGEISMVANVVRGGNTRSAYRTYDKSYDPHGPLFTNELKVGENRYQCTPKNPTHGVRVVVNVN